MKEYFSYRIFIILLPLSIICSGSTSTKQVYRFSPSLRKYMLHQSTNLLSGYLDIICLPIDEDAL